MLKIIGYFLLAVLLAASAGSIVQSISNLQAIAQLAGAITFQAQSATIVYDLQHFMPMLAVILLPIMLLSILLNALLCRFLPLIPRVSVFVITALITYLALSVINHLAPMPTLIALNRTVLGTLLLLGCSASAAVFFHAVTAKRRLL